MSNEISLLDDITKNKVRTMWLENMSITDICKRLEISTGTWDSYYWLNKNGFRDFVNSIKKEAFINNAEKISREITSIDAKNNAKLLSIKQKEAEFLRETLGKDLGYSKRVETIGLNINKNEPLDEDQRKKLDKLFGKVSGKVNVSVEYAPVDEEVVKTPDFEP
jgi:hypothetical protein